MADLNAHYSKADLGRLRSEIVMVTPEQAKVLRADCVYDRQRAIDFFNVKRLALEMERGWFVRATPLIFCVLPDNSMVLVNGNHTLEAIKLSGVSVPLTFIYIKVRDAAEVAQIYSNLDLQMNRSWRAALMAHSGSINAFDAKALAAIGFIMSRFTAGGGVVSDLASKSRGTRFALLDGEYRKAVNQLQASLHGHPLENVSKTTRAPVMAVGLLCTRHQPAAAFDFWSGLAADDGLKAGDPRKTLLRYLANSQTAGRKDRVASAKATATAWNAFYSDTPLEILKVYPDRPIRILGTPWHKGDPDKFPRDVEDKTPATSPSLFETGLVHTASGTVKSVVRYVPDASGASSQA